MYTFINLYSLTTFIKWPVHLPVHLHIHAPIQQPSEWGKISIFITADLLGFSHSTF